MYLMFQVSVDGVDDDGSPVSRSEFGFGDESSDDSFIDSVSSAGRVVTAPTSLNVFQLPNSQIKVS